jgi:hypothetical protein
MLKSRNMIWIVRVPGMEEIHMILIGKQSLETPRHRWKEYIKIFLERRMKRTGIIWLKETVSDGKNAVPKYLLLLNREKYFEQLTECFLLKKSSAQLR